MSPVRRHCPVFGRHESRTRASPEGSFRMYPYTAVTQRGTGSERSQVLAMPTSVASEQRYTQCHPAPNSSGVAETSVVPLMPMTVILLRREKDPRPGDTPHPSACSRASSAILAHREPRRSPNVHNPGRSTGSLLPCVRLVQARQLSPGNGAFASGRALTARGRGGMD